MIEFTTGDILRADVEAMVNSVNCVGVMGKGLAAQFKEAFPENFRAYEAACGQGQVQPSRSGDMDLATMHGDRAEALDKAVDELQEVPFVRTK